MEIIYKSRSLGYVETNDAIWFSNRDFNGLEKINKSTGRIELLKRFPEYDIRKQYIHSYMVRVKENFIFFPDLGDYITVYNIETSEFITVALDLEKIGKQKAYFSSACVYGQYIYIFPCRARKIIRYNVDLKIVTYLNTLDSVLDKIPSNLDIFMQQYEVIDGKVYFPFASLNGMLVFDLETEKADICKLNISGGCSAISYHRGKFYMVSSRNKEIYSWDKDTEELKAYDAFPEDFEITKCQSYNYLFGNSQILGEKIIFFPILGNMIVSFDVVSKEIYEERKIEDLYCEKWNTFWTLSREEKILVMLAGKDVFFYINETNGKLLFETAFKLDNCYNEQAINNYLIENHYYNGKIEKKGELTNFINFIQHSDGFSSEQKERNFGKDIYNILRMQE